MMLATADMSCLTAGTAGGTSAAGAAGGLGGPQMFRFYMGRSVQNGVFSNEYGGKSTGNLNLATIHHNHHLL